MLGNWAARGQGFLQRELEPHTQLAPGAERVLQGKLKTSDIVSGTPGRTSPSVRGAPLLLCSSPHARHREPSRQAGPDC